MTKSVNSKSLNLMSLLYFFAGLNHFIMKDFYLSIMPNYLPFHKELVDFSGIAEIGLSAGLYFPKTRKISAWGVILLLFAVFPANIYQYTSRQINLSVFFVRCIMQILLIFWAYKYTHK